MTAHTVTLESGIFSARFGKELKPLQMGGQAVREFAPGWQPKFIYTGFAPILLLELVHDHGEHATWYLDEALNRIGGHVSQLSYSFQWFLGRRYLELLKLWNDHTPDPSTIPHEATLLSIRSISISEMDTTNEAKTTSESAGSGKALSSDDFISLGLARIKDGDIPGGLFHLDKAFDLRQLQSNEVYCAFANAASETRHFQAILARFSTVLDEVASLIDETTRSLLLSWLGRAMTEMKDFAKAREYLASAIDLSSQAPPWTAAYLDICVRSDHDVFSEEIPKSLRADIIAFAAYVTALLGRSDFLPTPPTTRYSSETLASYWVHGGIKTIRLSESKPGDNRLQLEHLGFASAFLDAAYKGPKLVAERCRSLSSDIPSALDLELTDRMFDIVALALLRGKPLLCPFTGSRGIAYDSVDLPVYLYSYEGRVCLNIVGMSLDQAFSDCAWFLPADWTLVISGYSPLVESTLIQALARTFDNRLKVAEYLAVKKRPIMVADIAVGHLGHYIWNSISGWPVLLNNVPAGLIDIIATNRDQIFGGVKELYPDLVSRSRSMVEVDHAHQFYETMLETGAIASYVMDQYVRSDLATRVVRWCKDNCSPKFLAKVKKIRAECRPILLVTLRLDNRAWVEQESGLPKIINRLALDFPKLSVILDGLNADINRNSSHAFMSLDEELSLAKRIMLACPGVQVENSIGCTPAEGIVWADCADAFLAPVGAGMAKYRWITNKPGVAFSNETCLTPGESNGHLYERCRDDLVPMEYVEKSDVTDVDSGQHGERVRANFSMSWTAPYQKTFALLTRLFPGSTRSTRHRA